MDRVTVQLFGSEPVVARAVCREKMLRVLIDALYDTLRPFAHAPPTRDPSLPPTIPSPRFDERSRGVLNPDAEGVKAKLYMRPANDLRMCFSHRGAAHRWLDATREPTAFDVSLGILRTMQGMNPCARKTGEHVEREGQAWITAMTTETVVMSTFRYAVSIAADGGVGDGDGGGGGGVGGARSTTTTTTTTKMDDDDASRGKRNAKTKTKASSSLPVMSQEWTAAALTAAAYRAIDKTYEWTVDADANEVESDDDDDGVGRRPAPFSLERSPVSIHLPMHRMTATLVHAAIVAEQHRDENGGDGSGPSDRSDGSDSDGGDASAMPASPSKTPMRTVADLLADPRVKAKLSRLAEHPSRCLAFADQVRARLWVRNGEEVRRMALVYGSALWAGLGEETDCFPYDPVRRVVNAIP